jgi:hypothetical protein
MIEHKQFDQQSAAWLEAKLGKIGGTRLKQVFSTNNLDLVDELIAELGSGLHPENFVTAAMQRGIDLEPTVRRMFARLHDIEIEEIGLCESDVMPFLVCSPDGFSKDRTIGVEIKCPSTKQHVKTIRQRQVPAEYRYQVLNYFLVNERCEVMYFVSFDDRYRPLPYFELRMERKDIEPELTAARVELVKFWAKFENYRSAVVGGV